MQYYLGHISSEQFYEELNLICDVSPLARRSLGCQFDINHNYGLNTIGTCFPFLNRTESSVAIVNVFKEQDRVRKRAIKALKSGNASTWETFKRAIKFPLCMGLSGCGKSTAARKAVPVYLETVKERTAFDENLATAAKKCNYQLGKLCHVTITMKQLVCISAMDSLSEDPVLSIVHKIIIELLNEASKYSADAVDDPLLHKKRIEQLVIKYSSVVDLSSIYKWLLEKTGASCMIINIDETQALEESQLPKVLRALGEILCSGKALYYSVTGLYANRIIKGITDSFSEGISLILPVLTVKHGVEICQSVGLLPESGDVNPFFRHLLWIAGGIPRNLDYLIYSVAEVVGVLHSDGLYYHASSMMSMQEYVQNLNHKRFNFIMDKWVSYCDIGFKKSMIWNDSQIMDSVVSLCIAGYPIRNTSCVLRDSNPIYTIENAQEDQILQLDSTSGAAVVPPIQLRSMYKKGTGSKCVDVQLLANDLNGIMSSRDNETLYMAVLLRRIRAKRVLGFKTMPLSEVLGVVPPSSFDFSIDISGPGTYNFVRQKSGGVAPPVGRNSGSISPPTESFADGYLRYVI